MTKGQSPALPPLEERPELSSLFEETGDREEQRSAALMRHRGSHFEREPLIPADQLNTPDFPLAEKDRLDAFCADADFLEATTRRDQIAVAGKHLRSFLAG
jgi:hypothetical protein